MWIALPSAAVNVLFGPKRRALETLMDAEGLVIFNVSLPSSPIVNSETLRMPSEIP